MARLSSRGFDATYSLWTRRYWYFFLIGSAFAYMSYDMLGGIATERRDIVSWPVLAGSLSLLVGATLISLPFAFKRAQGLALTAVLLAISCELYSWHLGSLTRLSVPFLVAVMSLLSRFAPSLALGLTVVGLSGGFMHAVTVERKFPSVMVLVNDQSILWMTGYLCWVGCRRSFALQCQLMDSIVDHLQYLGSDRGFGFYDVSDEQIEFVHSHWLSPVVPRLWSSMETRFRAWMRLKNTDFFTKHSLLVAFESTMLVVIVAPYERFQNSYPLMVVQTLSIVLLIGSLFLISVARLFRSSSTVTRGRITFLTSVAFLLGSAVFSSVYSVINSHTGIAKEAANEQPERRDLPVSNTPIDAWLFTSIATFLVLDVVSWILASNAVMLVSGLVYFKLWALTETSKILIYGLQYVLLLILLMVHKVAMENAMRILFLFSGSNASGDRRSSEGTRVVALGAQTHMSSSRTLYHLRIDDQHLLLVSTMAIRERLWRVSTGNRKLFVIDRAFDRLPAEIDQTEEAKLLARLTALLTRIAQNLSPKELQFVFGKRPVPPLNITIQTVGSRGDVQPFLFVARELELVGHSVVVSTHEKFRKFVEDFGVRFFPLALVRDDHWQPEQLMRYAEANPAMGPELLMRPKALYEIVSNAPEMANTIRTIFRPPGGLSAASSFGPIASASSADAIIANPPSYVHVHLAEGLGIPLHIVFTMPWTSTRTVGHPLCVSSAKANAFWKELSYKWMEFLQWRAMSSAVNDFRTSLGLERHNSTDASIVDHWRVPFSYMFSQVLLPKPPDWGPHIDVTGFVVDSPAAPTFSPPASLAAFLQHKPVYIGFGSITSDLSRLYRQVLIAIRGLPEVKFLVHKGWAPLAGLRPDDFPDNCFLICPPPPEGVGAWEDEMRIALGEARMCFLSSVPHAWLLPQCSAVVHHGGAGTTAAGLAAGRPTVVCAFFGDQVIWAQMVERLRCGAMLLARNATADDFKQAFQFVLTAEAQKNARDVANALELEQQHGAGAKAVVEAFEQQLAVELVACEVCEKHKADRVAFTFGLRVCGVCSSAINDFKETHLRRVDWGHSRLKGGVVSGLSRISKAVMKLKRRPVQGFDAVGILGLVTGFLLAVAELLFELLRTPYHLLVNLVRVARGVDDEFEVRRNVAKNLDRSVSSEPEPGWSDRVRATVLDLKVLRLKLQLAQDELPDVLLSENIIKIQRIIVVEYLLLICPTQETRHYRD